MKQLGALTPDHGGEESEAPPVHREVMDHGLDWLRQPMNCAPGEG